MKVQFEVHESHVALWERDDWRIAIVMGGRGNGRSGTASRYAVSRLLGKEYTRGAIMRAVREDIRTSSWREINDRILEQNAQDAFRIVDNDMFVEHGANSLRAHGFKASSGSLTARLKSLAGYNFVWIEEAEEITEEEFTTLNDTLRTVKGSIRIVLTLNTPAKSHWLIKKFFDLEPLPDCPGFYRPTLKPGLEHVIYVSGTFRENLPNLAPQTVQQYLAYKTSKPGYYWQVIEGLSPEVVRGRIYSGWRRIDAVPHEARLLGYGLDFGFDPDPAAIVAIYYHNGGYILDEKVYEKRLLNEHLAEHIKLLATAPIVADSAEPKSIAELRRHDVTVIPCEKGKDSVKFGIKHVQGLRISYTASSIHLENEYENYAWKEDKDGADLKIEDPKCANHAMSAIRYFMTEMVKSDADPEREEREQLTVEIHRRETSVEQQADYGL